MKKMILFLAIGIGAAYLNFCGYEGIHIYAGMLFGIIGIVMLISKLKWERVALFLLVGAFAAFLNYHGHQGLLLEVAALVGLVGVIIVFGKLAPFFEWVQNRFRPIARTEKKGEKKERKKRKVRGWRRF